MNLNFVYTFVIHSNQVDHSFLSARWTVMDTITPFQSSCTRSLENGQGQSTKRSLFDLVPWWCVKGLITARTDLRAPRVVGPWMVWEASAWSESAQICCTFLGWSSSWKQLDSANHPIYLFGSNIVDGRLMSGSAPGLLWLVAMAIKHTNTMTRMSRWIYR